MAQSIIPFSGDIPQQIKIVEVDQNAAYPERGTRYAKFYKHSISADKWELRSQDTVFKEIGRTTSSGLLTTQATYVTTISVAYDSLAGGSLDSIELHDGSNNSANLRWSHRVPASGTDIRAQVWTFGTPLQFPTGLWWQNGTTHASGSLFLRVWGWTETP